MTENSFAVMTVCLQLLLKILVKKMKRNFKLTISKNVSQESDIEKHQAGLYLLLEA